MDGVFWGTMGDTLSALEADAGIHGVVFSSGLQRDVFTAGNDITELYMPVCACMCIPITPPSSRQKPSPDPQRHAQGLARVWALDMLQPSCRCERAGADPSPSCPMAASVLLSATAGKCGVELTLRVGLLGERQATSGVKFTTFWTAQTRFLTRLYKSPLVAIAAIRCNPAATRSSFSPLAPEDRAPPGRPDWRMVFQPE